MSRFAGALLLALCGYCPLQGQPTDMVLVPAGSFSMGQDGLVERARGTVVAAHQVYLDSFYIDRFEVTVAAWKTFIADRELGEMPRDTPRWGWLDEHPIVNVTWNQARSYCAWAGKRLPTEAEWSKAARGTDGRIYPWGNHLGARHLPAVANRTARVGSATGLSPYGAHDMVGNVWEWVADCHANGYFNGQPRTNPKGPGDCTNRPRVWRGGAGGNNLEYGPEQFTVDPADLDRGPMQKSRVQRRVAAPGSYSETLGFRCARDCGAQRTAAGLVAP